MDIGVGSSLPAHQPGSLDDRVNQLIAAFEANAIRDAIAPYDLPWRGIGVITMTALSEVSLTTKKSDNTIGFVKNVLLQQGLISKDDGRDRVNELNSRRDSKSEVLRVPHIQSVLLNGGIIKYKNMYSIVPSFISIMEIYHKSQYRIQDNVIVYAFKSVGQIIFDAWSMINILADSYDKVINNTIHPPAYNRKIRDNVTEFLTRIFSCVFAYFASIASGILSLTASCVFAEYEYTGIERLCSGALEGRASLKHCEVQDLAVEITELAVSSLGFDFQKHFSQMTAEVMPPKVKGLGWTTHDATHAFFTAVCAATGPQSQDLTNNLVAEWVDAVIAPPLVRATPWSQPVRFTLAQTTTGEMSFNKPDADTPTDLTKIEEILISVLETNNTDSIQCLISKFNYPEHDKAIVVTITALNEARNVLGQSADAEEIMDFICINQGIKRRFNLSESNSAIKAFITNIKHGYSSACYGRSTLSMSPGAAINGAIEDLDFHGRIFARNTTFTLMVLHEMGHLVKNEFREDPLSHVVNYEYFYADRLNESHDHIEFLKHVIDRHVEENFCEAFSISAGLVLGLDINRVREIVHTQGAARILPPRKDWFDNSTRFFKEVGWKTWHNGMTEADAVRPTYAAAISMDFVLRAENLTSGNCIDTALDAVRLGHLSARHLNSLIGNDVPAWIDSALTSPEFRYGLDRYKKLLSRNSPSFTEEFTLDPANPTDSYLRELIRVNMVYINGEFTLEEYTTNLGKQWCDLVLGKAEDNFSLEPRPFTIVDRPPFPPDPQRMSRDRLMRSNIICPEPDEESRMAFLEGVDDEVEGNTQGIK